MFDLVTEPEVFAAQRAVANEMVPQIEEYIARAEDGLEELKQRERALHAKVSDTVETVTALLAYMHTPQIWLFAP